MTSLRLIILAGFALFACSLPCLAQNSEDRLQAGTAAVDISPTVTPFQLRSGPSTYVHDPLHVRAIAFQNGEGRAVIALMDAIGVGRDMCDLAKAEVAAKTGWKPEEMLVAGTHTHSAPKGGDTSPGRIAYEERRLRGLIAALTQAIQAMEPAQVGFDSDEEASEVRYRRWFQKPETMRRNPYGEFDKVQTNGGRGDSLIRPAGPIDPEVCVVDVRTSRGRALGLIANYALHYVGGIPKVIEENGREVGMASADYFGEFARIMPYRVGGSRPPENFVAMMTNGASGDINNLPFKLVRSPRAPFEQAQIVASKTADAAWRAVKKIETYDSNPVIATRQREVQLTYREPTEADLEKALAMLELPRKERDAINSRASNVSQRTVEFANDEPGRTEGVLIQAIRIGDQAIVSMPFEVFVEIGLEIKEKSPFPHTFLVELANGGYGYLPTPQQHELGGYETWLTSARFKEDSSEVLTRNLLEMLDELKGL